jgi:hypoxanthine phosphoribosyltransferase
MESSDRFALIIALLVAIFLGGMILAGIHSDMLKHSCRLHAMEVPYDSAHIAQICGK